VNNTTINEVIFIHFVFSSSDFYRKRFQDVCTGKVENFGMTVMKDIAIAKSEFADGEKAITKIQDFTFDDELFQYCCHPDIVKYVESFTGPNIMAMHTMVTKKKHFFFLMKIFVLS
jgi:phytanoyl-CoA hydroxylase